MSEYMTRREIREHTFKILFVTEFRDAEEMPEQKKLYFSQIPSLQETDSLQISGKVDGVIQVRNQIDTILNTVAKGWKTTRMSKVDLSILRLAVYEILLDEKVPDAVAVNEAVELAKAYSSDDSSAFVNGILASVVKKREFFVFSAGEKAGDENVGASVDEKAVDEGTDASVNRKMEHSVVSSDKTEEIIK